MFIERVITNKGITTWLDVQLHQGAIVQRVEQHPAQRAVGALAAIGQPHIHLHTIPTPLPRVVGGREVAPA